jgi:hypothetical protein
MPSAREVVGTLWSATARLADSARLAVGGAQAVEGLRAGHFVHQVAVDVEDGGAVVFGTDHVGFPEFVVKRLHDVFSVLLLLSNLIMPYCAMQ